MLFWLFVIILAVGIGLIIVGNIDWDTDKHPFFKWLYWHDDNIECAGHVISIISGVAVAITLVIIIIGHMGVDAHLETNRERYNALVYKVENVAGQDKFGILHNKVIDEVQSWNEDVRYNKAIQDDFWLGIFYPNVYDEFETIAYGSFNAESTDAIEN